MFWSNVSRSNSSTPSTLLVATLFLLFSLSVFLGTSARAGIAVGTQDRAPKIRLISVGISEYQNFPSLRTPAEDAKQFAALFTSLGNRLSITSSVLLRDQDATREAILRTYHASLQDMQEGEMLIFYFSGHSASDARYQRPMLAPYDVEGIDSQSLLRMIDVFADLIAIAPPDAQIVIIADGCNLGASAMGPRPSDHPNVSLLSSTKDDELALDTSSFTRTISSVIANETADLDGDLRLSIEELYIQAYPDLVSGDFGRQHPTLVGLAAHRQYIASAKRTEITRQAPSMPSQPLGVDLVTDLEDPSSVVLNGRKLSLDEFRQEGKHLVFLSSDDSSIRSGFNLLQIGAETYQLWRSKQALRAFREPYKNSYAMLVAIDDYDRSEDKLHRKATGFPKLGDMVSQSDALADVLVQLGFPRDHIIKLYNSEADSNEIEETLKTFWYGGSRADADRLFFYFGGHGDQLRDQSRLITYDYDAERPLLTTFDSEELITKHSRNIAAKHVLFALDACFSGLTLLSNPDAPAGDSDQDEFARLAIIERNITEPARAIMVAGTGNQKALWQNGGIFTQKLIAGLSGNGDSNKDGLIEFEEVGKYVRDQVTIAARPRGIRQDPDYRSLESSGSGRFMFFRGGEGR
ncbi:caspase family protein (plasmid) [Rhizobium leguminosarum]|uniref:caspase family protein n=1 Tax=Rhizobium leguminosarum TaxID=384 RepID=UPI0010301AF5|nr:caspase family protein [Rhizobium leguminosarum]TBG75764.1 caspase family protein [Rhizobium leguminosarum]